MLYRLLIHKIPLKLFLVLSFFFIPTLIVNAQDGRKRVAVVLSGGGAKGVAHVKALKVIEEAGIPVDIVVGTSMGSIVGGLYASGYNAEQLDSIVMAQNWTRLLTDGVDRRKQNFSSRQEAEQFIVSAHFEKSPFEVMQGGILKANSISMLMTELTADHQDSIDYDRLPIRFACVATDLLTGKEVVMHNGILAESMRASMAIPGVFAPVKKGGYVLVDGGMTNNFPVDVAREMGAEIVIGVDVGDESSRKPEDINTPVDVLMKMMDNMTSNKLEENIAMTDVYIKVDVSSYNAASFSTQAIDTLLSRGDKAARNKWDELVVLREKIGLSGDPHDVKRSKKQMDYKGPIEPPSSIYNARNRASYIGVGARFDNEELASILLGGMYEFNHKNKLRAGLKLRLGKRFYTDLTGSVNVFEKWNFGAQYTLKLNQLNVYDFGSSVADIDYTENFFRLNFSRSWRMMKLTIGADCSLKHFTKVNTVSKIAYLSDSLNNENSISYNLCLEYDNMDDVQYPHKGIKWLARYNYYTDNGYQFNKGFGLHIIDGYFKIAIPFTRSTTFVPYIAERSIFGTNTHFCNRNVIGGVDHIGFYVPQQYSFVGVNYLELMDDNIAILGATVRQRLFKKHYLFGAFNVVTEGDKNIFEYQWFGACLGYGYRSPIGPIEANINWSSITKRVGFYVNLGYKF